MLDTPGRRRVGAAMEGRGLRQNAAQPRDARPGSGAVQPNADTALARIITIPIAKPEVMPMPT